MLGDAFHLTIGEVLQGDWTIRDRTLLLVFQVNCPGCFHYALPLAEAIHQEGNRLGLSVLALSTAFEDFDQNTVEHTRALVEQGTLVGASRRSLSTDTYPGTLSFPVAADAGMERSVGETFATNRLMGTPTWLVLANDGRVLEHWFGRLASPSIDPLQNLDE